MRDFFRRGPVRASALAGLVFHTLALAWIWWRWSAGVRSAVVLYMDFPFSLAYLAASSRTVFFASLLAGGALWSAIAALLAAIVGALARRR